MTIGPAPMIRIDAKVSSFWHWVSPGTDRLLALSCGSATLRIVSTGIVNSASPSQLQRQRGLADLDQRAAAHGVERGVHDHVLAEMLLEIVRR